MARKRVDWEAVEKDYRTGQHSLRELGEKHGCNNALIARKAKAEGWKKDLSKQVRDRAKAKAVEKRTGKQADAEIVEAASEAGAEILARHQGRVGVWQQRTERYAELIDNAMQPQADEDGLPIPVDIKGLGTALNAGTQALQRLIQLERQAFDLDETDAGQAGKTLEELLAQVAE